ncbi:MAG: hypothetical protein WBW31_17670 [Candidatus Sulfotelmatobacter sp.]
MGALARALKAKFSSPKDALRCLGLPEDLLDVKQLANDAKQRARREAAKRGMAIDGIGTPEELRAARDLTGEAFEKEQRRLDRELEDGMVEDWRDEIGPTLEEMAEKHGRRATMDRFSRFLSDKAGWSHDQIHEMLKAWPLPKNALAGGMGGELAEDDEERAALAEDIDWTMEQLTGEGGSSMTGPGYEDSPKAGDRKRRARDRRMARDSFAAMYPDAQRLDGSDASHRYGDQLVMDAAADDDGSFDAFFPDAKRIGIAG